MERQGLCLWDLLLASPKWTGPAATDRLDYLHTDHLGSLTLMILPNGTLHSDGTARYQPFGAFQQAPPANPGLTRHGYTNRQHHNTGDGDIGLITMQARTYLPGLARFASPGRLPDRHWLGDALGCLSGRGSNCLLTRPLGQRVS